MSAELFDVVIVGGGPAGLSASLMLGRSRRRVLVCDNKEYRNAYSRAMHGFLSRDGINPAEFRQIAQEQLEPYQTVEIRYTTVTQASRHPSGFSVILENGETVLARKLLLATGLRDQWPTMKGAPKLYGTSIFHCPYCDGWELRDQPLAAYGRGDKNGGQFALELRLWSKDLVLCTDGPAELSDPVRERLNQLDITIHEERIIELIEKEGVLDEIFFETGERLKRRAIFFNTKASQSSDLAAKLGCEFTEEGGVKVGKYETTNVPGLFVAGDSTRDVLQAVVAASEGVEAAFAINTSLLKQELMS